MLIRMDLDIYKYDRIGLFIMVFYIILFDSYYGILLYVV